MYVHEERDAAGPIRPIYNLHFRITITDDIEISASNSIITLAIVGYKSRIKYK